MESRAVGSDLEARLGQHLASATRSDIPEPAVEQAKRAILWWTATALEGSTESEQESLRTFASRQGVNMAFKAYPCGIVAHPALDAVRSARPSIGNRAIHAVEVLGPVSLRIMADPIEIKRSPQTVVEAQFSIPWAVACVIRDDELTIDHYTDKSLADEELRRLAASVTVTLREGPRAAPLSGSLCQTALSCSPTRF
jgi:2-methylcitrate dehydratase PrpD